MMEQKEINKIMSEYGDLCTKGYEKAAESDNLVLDKLRQINNKLVDELIEVMNEDEVTPGTLVLIDKEPNFEADCDEYEYLGRRWVNQHTGYEADDFYGEIYYEIIPKKLFLMVDFSC